MPLCVLVKANKRQRHVFALFLHNPVVSKPSYFLQKPAKTLCTKFPTTQSSRYTLWLAQPKMGTQVEWLQPHSRVFYFFCQRASWRMQDRGFARLSQADLNEKWFSWKNAKKRLHLILQLPHTLFFPWNFTNFCFLILLLQLQNVDSFWFDTVWFQIFLQSKQVNEQTFSAIQV